LDEFFADWYEGEGYPSYIVKWWRSDANTIGIRLEQKTSHPSVDFFALPVPLRLVSADGRIQDVRLEHAFSGQIFLVPVDFEVATVEFDPELWLISRDNAVMTISSSASSPAESGFSFVVTPHPARSGEVRLRCQSAADLSAVFSLVSADGREVASQKVRLQPGTQEVVLPAFGCPAGTYHLFTQTEKGEWRQTLLLLP
jgi:hypothetical protein